MTFKAARKKVTAKKHSSVTTELYTSIADVKADVWNKAINSNDIFVSIPYLTALEQSHHGL